MGFNAPGIYNQSLLFKQAAEAHGTPGRVATAIPRPGQPAQAAVAPRDAPRAGTAPRPAARAGFGSAPATYSPQTAGTGQPTLPSGPAPAVQTRPPIVQTYSGPPIGGGAFGGFSMPSFGQPAQAQPAAAAPQLELKTSPDPEMGRFIQGLRDRLGRLEGGERESVSWSAKQATDIADRDIYGGAVGAKQRKREELAARGLDTERGVGSGELRSIDEAAQTRSAKSSSDIALARAKEQDALDMQRRAQVNSLYGALGGASQVPHQQALQQGALDLSAWQAADSSQVRRAELANQTQGQQLATWLAMMRLLNPGGGY